MQIISQRNIEKIILENYTEYQYLFVEFQSKFLSGLHSRYQSIESGNLVLYFAKQNHQDILRQKDYDLYYNISYERFWENHNKSSPKRIPIVKIGKDTFLPKETARRKILQLIKQKVLNKKNKNIGWLPSEQHKKGYNLVFSQEIDGVCKLIHYICKKINFSISREEIAKEIKEKFSFYWLHYLGVQLEYIKEWNRKFKDSELILIFLQVVHLFTSKVKEKNLSHKDLYDNSNLLKEFISSSISTTSISEITSVPRATCVRKLDILVKSKIILQDKVSKRYYVIPEALTENAISQKSTEKIVKLFSEFFFICIRTISVKI